MHKLPNMLIWANSTSIKCGSLHANLVGPKRIAILGFRAVDSVSNIDKQNSETSQGAKIILRNIKTACPSNRPIMVGITNA